MSRIHPGAEAFDAAADAYERARPSYPEEAVAWFVARTGLGPGRTVVDVGAGTGKLTRLLVGRGARVVAAEPVAGMRAKLVAAAPGAQVVDATAEALPLADGVADAVTAAQAFHWFDHERALPELHRVLRPGGVLALFWNLRDLSDPLQRRLESLLEPVRVRSGAAGHEHGAWREPLARSPLFGEPGARTFRHAQRFTVADLVDRVASTSFVAALDAPEREALLDQAAALAHGLEEPFPFPYATEVLLFPRTGDRAA